MSTDDGTAVEGTQPLIGRAAEIEILRALVEENEVAALTGAAGLGKSALVRTALPAARVVSLAGARDAADIAARTASILGFVAPDIAPAELAKRLAEARAVVAWEDEQAAAPGAVARALAGLGDALAGARLLIVSRRALAELALPSLVLGPLAPEACRALVAALDARRAEPLHARIAAAAAGNPLLARIALERAALATLGEPGELAALATAADPQLMRLLVAAGGWLDARALGPSLSSLAAAGLVERRGSRVRLEAAVAQWVAARFVPDATTWRALERLADAALARPGDDPDEAAEELARATRARLALGDAAGALAVLEAQASPRRRLARPLVESLAREVAVAAPSLARDAYALLAEELLARGALSPARTLVASLRDGGSDARLDRLAAAAALRAGELEGAAASGPLAAAARLLAGRPEAALALAGDDETRALAHVVAGDFARALEVAAGRAPLAETLALLQLDELDRAEARARALPAGPPAQLLAAALAWRRGELRAAAAAAGALAESLERDGDRLLGAAAATVTARAALGLGEIARAESLLRKADAVIAGAGALALAPPVELGFLLLGALRGDWSEARQRAERAAALAPGSPLGAVERWWARGDTATPAAASLPAATALYDLRAAERALGEGRCDDANQHARDAERAYRHAGAAYDRALALLARVEAVARLDGGAAADKLAEACAALADGGGYRVVSLALALVDAYRADRGGDLAAYVAALARARSVAGVELYGHALAAACARVGLPARPGAIADGQPMRDRAARLGLLRGADRLCSVAGRLHLLAADEPLPAVDLVATVDEGTLRDGPREWPLARQLLVALEALAEAGPIGLTLEQLYLIVWEGAEYHPLRHRNAVYVALNRLRAALEPALGKEAIRLRGADYALGPGVRLAVVREVRNLPERTTWRERAQAWPAGEPRDVAHWSRRCHVPPAQARWELALLAATESEP